MEKLSDNIMEEDIDFLTDTLNIVIEYARKKSYDPDDTIKTVGEWFVNLPDIATFQGAFDKEADND